ncbi:hypothetical protein [Enterococcus hirae]|uniref:hypothetical protein n=1 Tax=Enterococcus hirae TaxID=1354 RepID=UPI001A9760EB|nr:hypothetical protein [Enterococcus hirae]MBO1102689.1 hypothetical protein [Enterococcus hirae]
MDSINERHFEEKETAYLSEKRHLENQLEQTYEEKRAFHNYLDHLANYVNYPTPHYDVSPNKQVVYRLLTNCKEEIDQRIRQKQLAIESQLDEQHRQFQKERFAYEESKRKGK